MRVFVVRHRLFALSGEQFSVRSLTNRPFVCIMGEEHRKERTKMYNEVVRVIMRSQTIDMISCFSLAILIPVIYLLFFDIPFKKKKMSKKKRNQKKKEVKEAFTGAVVISICLLICGCIFLGDYLSLRQDLESENYVTYTGEFRYYTTGGRHAKHRVQWIDENGEKITLTYRRDVRKF